MEAAVWLQHEAYRDGVVTEDNEAETAEAVIGHTMMADRIESDSLYGEGFFGGIIGKELEILRNAKSLDEAFYKLAGFSLDAYDSSADNWLIKCDGDRLIIENDGENNIYILNEDGEKELLSEHNPALYNQIHEKQQQITDLIAQGKHTDAIEAGKELAILQTQYDESNTVNNEDGYFIDRMIAGLLYGDGASTDKSVYENVYNDDSTGEFIYNALTEQLKLNGFKSNRDIWSKDGSVLSEDSEISMDITDLFLSFSGLDRRGILGNDGYITDKVFGSIHKNYADGAIISIAQDYLDIGIGRNYESGNCTAAENSFDAVKYASYELANLKDFFGISDHGDDYNRRLDGYIGSREADLSAKINTALNYEFESQKLLSFLTKYGYDDAGKSSLCHAESLMEAHGLNTMVDVNMQMKADFINLLKTDKRTYYNGEPLVSYDGSVKSAGTFLDRFAVFLNNKGYTAELLAPTSHNAEGIARFAEGYASGHYTTIDTLDFNGDIIWDSYNLKTSSSINYLESLRFSYIYDFLDYSLWGN